MNKNKSGSWRYQAVYIEHDTGKNKKDREYSICEIYLDKDGRLENWTESPSIAPGGVTFEELTGDIRFMLDDVSKWEAVAFESLRVGMTIEENKHEQKNEILTS